MAMIFLSYSRKDFKTMRQVKKALTQRGISVWTDENLKPGTDAWKRKIEQKVKLCDAFVVLMSPNAYESIWVQRECTKAQDHSKPIFPLLIGGNSKDHIPLELCDIQYIDLQVNRQDGLDSLVQEFKLRGWVKVDFPNLTKEEPAKIESHEQEIGLNKKIVHAVGLLEEENKTKILAVHNELLYPSNEYSQLYEGRSAPVSEDGATNISVKICYDRSDFLTMRRVKHVLELAGISVWTDEKLRPGTQVWERASDRALLGCDALVVLMSPNAYHSGRVVGECGNAIDHGKEIFPVLIEGDISDSIPLFLSDIQVIDIQKDFKVGISKLVNTLRQRGSIGDSESKPKEEKPA